MCQLEANIESNNNNLLEAITGLVEKVKTAEEKTNERLSRIEEINANNQKSISEISSRLEKTIKKTGEVMPKLEKTIWTNRNILKGISSLEEAVKTYQYNSSEAISRVMTISTKNESDVSEILRVLDKSRKSASEKMTQLEARVTVGHNNVSSGVSRLEDTVNTSNHDVNERLNQIENIISAQHDDTTKRLDSLEEHVKKTARRMSQLEELINANKNVVSDVVWWKKSGNVSQLIGKGDMNPNDTDTGGALRNISGKMCMLETMKDMCDRIPQLEAIVTTNQEILTEGINRFEWFMDSIYSSNVIERIDYLEESVNRALSILPQVESLLSNLSGKPTVPQPLMSVATTPSSTTSSTGGSNRTSTFTDTTSQSTSIASTPVASTTDSTGTSNNDFVTTFKNFQFPSSSTSTAESMYSTANSSASSQTPTTVILQPDICREAQASQDLAEDWWMLDSSRRIRNESPLTGQRNLEESDLLKRRNSEENDQDGAADYQRDNSLFIACRIGHTRRLKMLLKSGANVHRKDANGCTPLHVASLLGHAECVRILLAAGANRECKNDSGDTPLNFALTEEVRDILRQNDKRFQGFLNRFLNRR